MVSFQPAKLILLTLCFGLSLASNELFARRAVTSYGPAQTSACINLARSCYPTTASCTPAFCSSCASLGGPDFISCCQGTNAAGCISTLLATAAGTGTVSETDTAATTTPNSNDPNVIACRSAVSLVNSCASATPGFSSMLGGPQASCLCYTSSGTETIYAPSIYDDAQSGCVKWAKTADTSDYSLFASVAGLCTAVGDVRKGSAAATTTASETGTAVATSPSISGGAVSTRTASITSATSSRQTGSIVMASSSGFAAPGLCQVPDHIETPWGLSFLFIGLGWLL